MTAPAWPVGNGEMAQRIRAHDWAATPLGPVETWSQSLRTIVDLMLSSPSMMSLVWGAEAIHLYNDAFTVLLREHSGLPLGRSAFETFARSRDVFEADIAAGMAGRSARLIEQRYPVLRSGRLQDAWFDVDYAPVRDGTGRVAGVLWILKETTARHLAETALRESETRLQAAIDLVGLSPYAWDPRTGALHWDARIRAIWGLPADAAVDHDVWLSGIHPDDRERVAAAAARSIDPDGDGSYDIEYRVVGLTDGVERWVSARARTFFEGCDPVRHIGAVLEITERKRAEARLRESEERFRQFAENAADVLWIFDVEASRLEYLSPAFERVWDAPRGAVMGDWTRWAEALHPEDRERVLGAVERVLEGEVVAPEYRIIRADGAVRWIRGTAFPIRDEQGNVRRVGGIAQDITRHDGSLVYLVDGDEGTRQSLTSVLRGAGYEVKTFAAVRAFLEAAPALLPGCVVLGIQASEAGGLAVPRELKARRVELPVIVMGECHGDIGLVVQAMKAGAADYLELPYEREALLTAVASALADIHDAMARDRAVDLAKARIAEMSPREREVLDGLLAGGTNKSIARGLGLSPRTVEVHRAHVMERLGAYTLPEAVLMAAAAGLQPPPRRSATDPDQA